ncbi:FAD:protein FMN transferase [Neobacillus drentensis]|uniref:FAD:protein FMN transferase n=1 Tax=Neobacillus drentensis TaxID=220684 RepID=UPI0028552B94|nr:FAD:protein FMN transferase [Neobacillus drentensis]MDR7239788.1 thiamine biosynthesis lipoprotein [Neobacillus drentensis]
MFTYRFPSMSTIVQITISHELFANDLMPVYKLVNLIEDTCSRFRPDSELSRLNQQIDREIIVSKEMFSILTDALRFYEESEGIFNPGVLSALVNNGYAKSIEMIKGREIVLASPSPTVPAHSQPFLLDEKKQSVTLFTKIDLGGIAKGWVIDHAAQLLEKEGYGFINVGGDMRIFGTLPRHLNIGIESPFAETEMISSIQVQKGALATSTTMKRKWLINGEWSHHIIDPRTGGPSESKIVSATVTAPTALEADVWAKTVLLLGEKAGQEWINRNDVQAVVINKNGDIWRGEE